MSSYRIKSGFIHQMHIYDSFSQSRLSNKQNEVMHERNETVLIVVLKNCFNHGVEEEEKRMLSKRRAELEGERNRK